MAGLQRSVTSFRRQGSSGMVWDDKFLAELNQIKRKEEQEQGKDDIEEVKQSATVGSTNTIERSRSTGGGRGYRTGKVSPAIEPPSPRVFACGLCSAFGKSSKTKRSTKPGKRRSR